MTETKFMGIKEFRDKGFLQEANRRFFNPLGLALAVCVDDNGAHTLHGIRDCREDPDGFVFSDLSTKDAKEKAKYIDDLMNSKLETRLNLFGSIIQPIGHKFEDGK